MSVDLIGNLQKPVIVEELEVERSQGIFCRLRMEFRCGLLARQDLSHVTTVLARGQPCRNFVFARLETKEPLPVITFQFKSLSALLQIQGIDLFKGHLIWLTRVIAPVLLISISPLREKSGFEAFTLYLGRSSLYRYKMSTAPLDMQSLNQLRCHFSQALKDFAISSSSFLVLRTIPTTSPPSPSPIRALYVLDSSFNPPSRAHLSLVKTALKSWRKEKGPNSDSLPSSSPRVLFLLATVNADKKPKPADFEDRLIMMTLMAEELRHTFAPPPTSTSTSPSEGAPPIIDIGITKEPYFIDKASSITESNIYTSLSPLPEDIVEQIHLTGFDTLTRIFNPKYYPNHNPPLSALAPFLSRHRLRATIRVDPSSGSQNLKEVQSDSDFSTVESQRAYLERIASGDFEVDGLKREWARQVELVVDESGEAEGVSSTRIRDGIKEGNWEDVRGLVGEGVESWIRQRGLYRE